MLNWVKIRVWEQEQWDGIIMIDVDVTVLGDLTHLFHLPTDFAAVPDNGKVWNRWVIAMLLVQRVRCCYVQHTISGDQDCLLSCQAPAYQCMHSLCSLSSQSSATVMMPYMMVRSAKEGNSLHRSAYSSGVWAAADMLCLPLTLLLLLCTGTARLVRYKQASYF